MVRIICPNCSHAFPPSVGGDATCPKCGYVMSTVGIEAPAAGPSFSSGSRAVIPPPISAPAMAQAPMMFAQPSNGLAVTAMVLGIVGVLFAPLAPLAFIFGVVGLIVASKRRQVGRGMAITGIVLGAIVSAVWIFLITSVFPYI